MRNDFSNENWKRVFSNVSLAKRTPTSQHRAGAHQQSPVNHHETTTAFVCGPFIALSLTRDPDANIVYETTHSSCFYCAKYARGRWIIKSYLPYLRWRLSYTRTHGNIPHTHVWAGDVRFVHIFFFLSFYFVLFHSPTYGLCRITHDGSHIHSYTSH